MKLTEKSSHTLIALGILGSITITGLTACEKKSETVPAMPATATAPAQTAQAPAAPSAEAKPEEKATEEKKPETKPARKSTPAKSSVKHSDTEKTAAKESAPEKKAATHVCQDCGTITAIHAVEQEGEGSGLGAIAGGVAGAVLGHQVGGGTGKDLATIAGAAGGAYAGHQIEKKMKKTVRYDITVKMENGKHRTVSQKEAPAFAVGDKVKIVDGILQGN